MSILWAFEISLPNLRIFLKLVLLYNLVMLFRSLRYLDKKILFCIASLFLISSFCMAAYGPASIFRHVLLWLLGMAVALYMHAQDSKLLIKISKIMFVFSIMLIILTYFRSDAIKGSKRWISLFGISFQSSELLKSSCIILTSQYIYKNNFLKFFMIYLIGIILLVHQPDFGSILLLLAIMMIQLFISNVRAIYLIMLCIISAALAVVIVIKLPHVRMRIVNFVYGNQSILEGGYQGFMSVQTIKSGGWFGLGIGKGVMKKYLPDAYSDFIFAVIAEELGAIGCLYLIMVFLLLGWAVFISNNRLLGSVEYYINTSCMSIFLIQAWINIASALWIIPTKGTTLPFVSHGGTSLLISFWTLSGILVSMRKAKFTREIKLFE